MTKDEVEAVLAELAGVPDFEPVTSGFQTVQDLIDDLSEKASDLFGDIIDGL